MALLIACVAVVSNSASAQAASVAQNELEQRLLIHFDAGVTVEHRDAVIAQMGGELVVWMEQIHVAEVRLPLQVGTAGAMLPASVNEMVTFAELDMPVSGAFIYNDPDFSDETMSYALHDVEAVDAWDVITGSEEIVIAVVDSGVRLDHPEFAGRLVTGFDFVRGDGQADDEAGHGTHVAGIIAAGLNNGQGLAGVCPNCRLMPVKVLNENNMGSWSQLSQGILFAVDNGAQIINLSLGSVASSETLAEAIAYAIENDVIVVAAAGNYGSDTPFYPAALDGVIAVGATTSAGERWSKSNYGSYIDFAAPGSLVYSTYHDLDNLYHGYTYMSGTSMAAPFVAGIAGLLLSVDRTLSVDEVIAAMAAGANDLGVQGWDVQYGFGRVSAYGALMSPALDLADGAGGNHLPAPVVIIPADSHVSLFLPALNNN